MSHTISRAMRRPDGVGRDDLSRFRHSRKSFLVEAESGILSKFHSVAPLPRRQQTNQISPGSQQGFVLVTALILLLVLTLLGLAAAQSTSLQERMAGNARNHNIAFQAAESALVAGQNCVVTDATPCGAFNAGTTGGNGMYLFNPTLPTAIWNQTDFWSTSGNTLSYTDYTSQSLPQVKTQPQFIIEQMPPVAGPGGSLGQAQFGGGAPNVKRWRITSLGTGGDKSSTVMLQAVITN